MTQRAATQKEQLDIIRDAVVTAITQAAELSGLRNWMIRAHFLDLKPGEWPNEEKIVQGEGQSLQSAFEDIIDPNDTEFWESTWATDYRTAFE
jgi:hypothetical protein